MQHGDFQTGIWSKLSLVEQMANIGSEVMRSMSWKKKNNIEYANMANFRALELFDLTLADTRHGAAIKEIARSRELWLDYFLGPNQYKQTSDSWKKYFLAFTYAARNK